jgi:hypothetical protein
MRFFPWCPPSLEQTQTISPCEGYFADSTTNAEYGAESQFTDLSRDGCNVCEESLRDVKTCDFNPDGNSFGGPNPFVHDTRLLDLMGVTISRSAQMMHTCEPM